ncbi:uncharacterized protein BX663DRAFT_491732 [Cokeromyces recurvatus]|uniref:uncharacterized protein n=1 Tax=Cokeromyces recurvatus TaxID=90255 RepID=UPI00221F0B65|nr:uncharacterized protein BX663DRAFT_491732 [Cokeromyces recurvatus]KAI7907687.1 hypothetical protein BX663DRAFT_491732 [Cokeromyces recurvatus]
MRHLFDSRKEQKSLKLVKRLQEEAEKEWELECQRRREQELNDEAIAKELQAQLEEEERQQSSSLSSPPPLPVKPSAYNNNSNSTSSLPAKKPSNSTSTPSPPITPLYGLSSANTTPVLPSRQSNQQQNKKQSYLTYKPELQFNVASPSPEPSSIFYQPTPRISPISPAYKDNQPMTNYENTATSQSSTITHMEMPVPTDVNPIIHNYTAPSPIISDLNRPSRISSSSSVPTEPILLPLGQQRPQPIHHQSAPSALAPMIIPKYDSPSPYYSSPSSQQELPINNATFHSTPTPTSYANMPIHHAATTSLPQQINKNNVIQHASYPQQPISFEPQSIPPSELSTFYNTTLLNHSSPKASNSHGNKSLYTDSMLSLKPDEEIETSTSINNNNNNSSSQDTTSNKSKYIPPRPPTPIPSTVIHGEEEQEEKEEDKLYDKPNNKDSEAQLETQEDSSDESDWEDTAVDPFADNFAVMQISKESTATTATILKDNDPPIKKNKEKPVNNSATTTIEILDPTLCTKKDEKVQEENEELERPHAYMEKESEEIENYNRPHYYYTTTSSPAVMTPFYTNSYLDVQQQQQQQQHLREGEELQQQKVYPTNMLRAGAPPLNNFSAVDNSYYQKQIAVPATDYGYFKEEERLVNKNLPKLPKTTSEEDRHITVASINPEQRVWIRIHPTDTGKLLAERIHIVASYQTRRVTKITTKTGRNIPLDNTPLFDDWNEILNFKDGEPWTVEWVPIEHPCMDIITEGKEFMRQLKATFKGSS